MKNNIEIKVIPKDATYDDLVEELDELTSWQVIVATNDANALMSRVAEIRNKINNHRL